MSAVGIAEKPSHIEPDNFVNSRQSRAARYGAQWMLDIWGSTTFAPVDVYRMIGYYGARRAVRSGLLRRMREGTFTSDEEKEVFTEWVLQMGLRRKSSEICVYHMLAPMAYAERPLCHDLPKLNIQISFMYGEYDWVTRDVADNLVQEGKVDGEVFITSLSGHHLYLEAAKECVACLLKFTHGE